MYTIAVRIYYTSKEIEMLLEILEELQDFRRGQGRQYQIGHVLYFSILAILSGADSYRKIHIFIKKKTRVKKEVQPEMEADSGIHDNKEYYTGSFFIRTGSRFQKTR